MAFTPGSTAFGYFDYDPAFVIDADRLVKYVSIKLGGGNPALPGIGQEDDVHVQVELSATDVYTAFEEATIEYGSIVNSYQARSTLSLFLGSPTGSLSGSEGKYPKNSLEWARRISQPYGEEAYAGGDRPLYSGSIDLVPGVQDYDLQVLVNPTGSDGSPNRMIIRKIFHFSPFSTYRFFGTNSATAYLNGQFNFQTGTPESVFYMLPVWEDVLRGGMFELSNKVRRSNYSYEIHNNVLKVLPMPSMNLRLHFTYNLTDPHSFDPDDPMSWGVSNMSNIPFGNIQYSAINSMGRQWIMKMTLSLCKEIVGYIRRKVQQIPMPGGDLSLDGPDLVNDARAEMEELRDWLRGILDDTTYEKMAAREAEQRNNLQSILRGVPLKIYVG